MSRGASASQTGLSSPTEPEVSALRASIPSAEFTPGPWRVGADLCRVHPAWRDESGNVAQSAYHQNGYAKTIATVANENHDWRDIGAQVADAHLIAAAPELFEALAEMVRDAERNQRPGGGDVVPAKAYLALDKARGQ